MDTTYDKSVVRPKSLTNGGKFYENVFQFIEEMD